jgi:hypothetical protein
MSSSTEDPVPGKTKEPSINRIKIKKCYVLKSCKVSLESWSLELLHGGFRRQRNFNQKRLIDFSVKVFQFSVWKTSFRGGILELRRKCGCKTTFVEADFSPMFLTNG